MNGHGESDRPIVPAKSANKSSWDLFQELAERMEGRGLAKESLRRRTRPIGPSAAIGLQHEWSRTRQAATRPAFDPRQEPGAVIPPAGICAGGGGQPPSLPRLGSVATLIPRWILAGARSRGIG